MTMTQRPKAGDRVTVTLEGTVTGWKGNSREFEFKTDSGSYHAVYSLATEDEHTTVTVHRGPLPEKVGTVLYDQTADVTFIRIGSDWSEAYWVNLHSAQLPGHGYIEKAWADGFLEVKTTL
jgi:hypothetical protein